MANFLHLLWSLLFSFVAISTAFRIEIPQGTRLQAYNRDGYRQLPYHLVGFYEKGSWVNRLAGFADTHPIIEFLIDADGGSNSHFQLFLYNVDVVERQIVPSMSSPSSLRPITPCMEIGQEHGVAVFPSMKGNAFAIDAAALMVGTGTNYQHYAVRGRIYPESTGLYAVTMNACEFVNVTVTNSDGTKVAMRQLVTTGWDNIQLKGYITGRNPYGYLPGQMYGYLPVFTLLFVLACGVSVVFLFFVVRVARSSQSLLPIHYVLLVLTLLSLGSYWLLFVYYSRLNDANEDLYPIFVIGNVLLIVRNTLGVAALYLLCYGFSSIVGTLRPVVRVLLAIGLTTRLALCITEFGLFQQATNIGSSTGLYGVASYQQPHLGWKTARVFAMVVDGLFILLSSYHLVQSIGHCKKLLLKRRLRLFQRTAAALVSGAVVALCWVLVSYQLSDGPLGTVGEVNWKWMWLPSSLYELTYFGVFAALAFIWLPRECDIRLWNVEMYRQTDPAPPSNDTHASEVLSTPDIRIRKRTPPQPSSASSQQDATEATDVEMRDDVYRP